MREFLKYIFNSEIIIFFRSLSGFRDPIFNLHNPTSFLVSDLFFWRTDESFSTVFNASDILSKYFGEDSSLLMIFFNSEGCEIFRKIYKFDGDMISVTINKALIGYEGIGTFVALNIPEREIGEGIKITNRCYVGYGKDEAYSMMHGNMLALKAKLPINRNGPTNLKSAVSSRRGKYVYYLQRPNLRSLTMSLVFVNPLGRNISIKINSDLHTLKKGSCCIIDVNSSSTVVKIESDFIWSRPIIFSRKGDFIDVHHG